MNSICFAIVFGSVNSLFNKNSAQIPIMMFPKINFIFVQKSSSRFSFHWYNNSILSKLFLNSVQKYYLFEK